MPETTSPKILVRSRLGTDARPGGGVSIATARDLLQWHPHLERVGEHQSKKTAMLRKLSISENLPAGAHIASPLDAKPA